MIVFHVAHSKFFYFLRFCKFLFANRIVATSCLSRPCIFTSVYISLSNQEPVQLGLSRLITEYNVHMVSPIKSTCNLSYQFLKEVMNI